MDNETLNKFLNKDVLKRFVDSCNNPGYLVQFREYMAECGVEMTLEEIKDSCEHAKQVLETI